MEQLTFELLPPVAPTFSSYVAGGNEETVAILQAVASGRGETGTLVFGQAGVGKTHLLKAVLAAAQAGGRTVRYFDRPAVLAAEEDLDEAACGERPIFIVDDIDTADEAASGRLFTLYNRLAGCGGQLLAASTRPPAGLVVREDLRSRLGWGSILPLHPLADEAKPRALAAFAQARGFRLPGEVIGFLLSHAPRDMGGLVAALAELDRQSLARKRPVSVVLAREWLSGRGLPL